MEGFKFKPEDTGDLRTRFDSYCKKVIYHAAHNTVSNHTTYLKRQWGGGEVNPEDFAQEVAQDVEDEMDATRIKVGVHEVVMTDPEMVELLYGLQRRKREILLMSEVLDCTLDEIAKELNLAYETVKSTKSKALRELRREALQKGMGRRYGL